MFTIGGSVCSTCGQLRRWDDLHGLPPVCSTCEPDSEERPTEELLRERGLW
jgi:hypothetical protein